MTKLDTLYLHTPVWAQNALCSLYGHRLIRRRYTPAYEAMERQVMARDRLSQDEVRTLRDARLQRTLRRAAEKVPHYRRLFRELGIDPASLRTIDDLKVLPVLTKAEVQAGIADFRSDDIGSLHTSIVKTSGSTGTGLAFPLTLQGEQEQLAVWWRYRARFGIDRNTWYGHFYGRSVVPLPQERPPFWRINRPGRQILFSGHHLTDRFLGSYLAELNRRRPPWIQGFPSLLSVMAGYLKATGQTLDYRPRALTVGGESLLPQQRQLIESTFGLNCRQHYGMVEAVANISECPEGRLHVDEDFGAVEFLPNGQGGPRGSHRIVATGFCNDAFPLIRYEIGDSVTLTDDNAPCPCGLPGRTVAAIDGRLDDYVVTPDGRKIGRLDHIPKGLVNVRECQIRQADPGGIEIRVVRGPGFTEADEAALVREARQRLGQGMKIEVTYTEALQRNASGKLRYVVSEVAQGQISQG